jgi:hypothetical protein
MLSGRRVEDHSNDTIRVRGVEDGRLGLRIGFRLSAAGSPKVAGRRVGLGEECHPEHCRLR